MTPGECLERWVGGTGPNGAVLFHCLSCLRECGKSCPRCTILQADRNPAKRLLCATHTSPHYAWFGQMNFPIIIFHDPDDQVVSYEGTDLVMAKAPSVDKAAVEVLNGLHDLYCNEPKLLAGKIAAWTEVRGR